MPVPTCQSTTSDIWATSHTDWMVSWGFSPVGLCLSQAPFPQCSGRLPNCSRTTSGAGLCGPKLSPTLTENREKLKKEADHSGLVGGWFKKRESSLGHLPARILGLYRALHWVQPRTQSRWPPQHLTLSRLCSWKRLPPWAQWSEHMI